MRLTLLVVEIHIGLGRERRLVDQVPTLGARFVAVFLVRTARALIKERGMVASEL